MTSIKVEDIRKIVLEVIDELEMPLTDRSKAKNASSKTQGPRVLIVFNAGIRNLNEALKQTRLIEEIAGKSGVFTSETVRGTISDEDIREKAGVRCILDTVKAEGIEKVLGRADILVLPTFCLNVAAKVAHLTCDDRESGIVLSALLQGKKVLASRDGFMVSDVLANVKLQDEIDSILKKLSDFGVIFCPTDRLYNHFQKIFASEEKKEDSIRAEKGEPTMKLITAKSINSAVENNRSFISLAPGGKITPLARDLAKDYSIKIIET